VLLASFCVVASESSAIGETWVGSRYTAPVEFAPQFADSTLRTVVHLTSGGDRLRLKFSNLYGRTMLKIGTVYVAEGPLGKKVTFNGRLETVLSAGASIVSDPVDLRASAGEELVVSVFYPDTIPKEITMHFAGDPVSESNALIPGNFARGGALPKTTTPIDATYFLMGVDVESSGSRGAIVALGDSITDGGIRRWPSLLAKRLSESGKDYGVLNAGVSGNRLLHGSGDGWGEMAGQSALNRFDYDVLAQPGVKYVILYEGINDLGLGTEERGDGSNPPTAVDMIEAVRRLYERAHLHGLRMYVATLAPFEGAVSQVRGYYSTHKDKVRREFNEWIRTTHDIDGYFDFDLALADPAHPNRINPALDSGDHLHPNDAGERALSEAVNVSFFR
jgi:lysophospholipase L1-like esterase